MGVGTANGHHKEIRALALRLRIRSDQGLTLEKVASESLQWSDYLINLLIKSNIYIWEGCSITLLFCKLFCIDARTGRFVRH